MISSEKAIARELKKRNKNNIVNFVETDPKFLPQTAFVEDKSRFLAIQSSRRAGKTNALALKFFKTLEKYPKANCIYLSLTQDSARDIMWPILHEINDKFKIGCTFTEGRLTMRHPNGSTLKLMGADLSNFIKRLKGRKYPGVAIDEAQDFGPHLQSLVNDVLTPSISDYPDGWLAMTGTPGPVPQGFFFDITQNRKYEFSVHSWTLLDNPYMPEPHQFISDLMRRYEWDDNNPTLLREWKNKWVLDVQALWVRYKENINHYRQLPNITPKKWNYIMGIDLGFKDADAIAIIAWHEEEPKAYLVEEIIESKQGITELINQINAAMRKYDISKMVIDEGGLGKKIAEELRRQHGIPVQQADKAQKQQNVEFLNDALRTGKFMAKSASRFAQDSYLVQIDWEKSRPDKIIIKKKPHSDIIDAVLYAFRECPIFAYTPPVIGPKYGTKEWADQQQSGMFDSAMEFFEKQSNNENY